MCAIKISTFMHKKRVYLITGAGGFVGACLMRKLIENDENVHILLKKETDTWRIQDIIHKANVHISDLADLKGVKKIIESIKPDIIYHLATCGAYPYQNAPDAIINTNILGTWNLLKATSRINYELFVNTGSSSEYGFKKLPMKETDSLEPASYYAVTKSSQTLLCSYIARQERKPIVTLRPFSVYGPYEEQTRFVPVLLRSLYLNEKMNLVSPKIVRDYIYIDDMVNAYLLVDKLKNFPGEIFNIGTGMQSTIKDAVDMAMRVTGKTISCAWRGMQNRNWDTDNWVADISKAKRLLGWKSKIGLKTGLGLFWKWLKSNRRFYIQGER
jgi:nucleoside-diphosphate-sugar epimerase